LLTVATHLKIKFLSTTTKNKFIMKRLLITVLFLSAFQFIFSQNIGYEDVIYLKNGGIIRGIIMEQRPMQAVKIETIGRNVFVFTLDEIEKIVKELPVADKNKINKSKSSLQQGYRGILETGFAASIPTGVVKLDIINGYQFDKHFFLGGGTGMRIDFETGLVLPLFADFRYNFSDKKSSPYISADLGYRFNLSEGFAPEGFLFSPTGGISFNLSDKMLMNVGLGFTIQSYYYEYDNDYYDYSNDIYGFIHLNIGISF
jgi:hypothetical protein